MTFCAQNAAGGETPAFQVKLDKFASPQTIAAWQAKSLLSLLDNIEKLAGSASDSSNFLCDQVDEDADVGLLNGDDEEDRLKWREEDLLLRFAYLLTAVVATTGSPNHFLPYDLSDQLSFDNRPNQKFARDDFDQASLLDGN